MDQVAVPKVPVILFFMVSILNFKILKSSFSATPVTFCKLLMREIDRLIGLVGWNWNSKTNKIQTLMLKFEDFIIDAN